MKPHAPRALGRRLLPIGLSLLATLTIAQTPAPPTPTPEGGLLQQVWETHQTQILLGLVTAVVSRRG